MILGYWLQSLKKKKKKGYWREVHLACVIAPQAAAGDGEVDILWADAVVLHPHLQGVHVARRQAGRVASTQDRRRKVWDQDGCQEQAASEHTRWKNMKKHEKTCKSLLLLPRDLLIFFNSMLVISIHVAAV